LLVNLFNFSLQLNVYKKIASTTGFMRIENRQEDLWNLLKELRDDIDFDVIDSWDSSLRPTYKGCEPMIKSVHPVKCERQK
jgi:hypothetical protein